MKTFKYLSFILAGLFLFAACQKEYSFETGLNGVNAVGSLKNELGDCQPVSVNGVYKQDSLTGSGNTVTIQAHITSAGSYKIFTDTQNGFAFRDSGVVADTGLQTFTLKAVGTPILSQETNFLVTFDTSFCMFSVSVIANTPATYSLVGSPNACSNYQVAGIFEEGRALGTDNKLSVQVNVTALGGYSIATSTIGGITFRGSGNFTQLGLQNVDLQASGTPTAAGTYTIPVTAGSSTCSFIVDVLTPGSTNPTDPNVSDSAWQFSQGTNKFAGPFFDVFDTTRAGVGFGLIFIGYTPATADTVLQMAVLFPGGTITPGTYHTNTLVGAFYFENMADANNPKTIYQADPTNTNADISITISSYNATTGIITGTFSGTAVNASNTPVPITGGKFRAKVRHT